MLRPNRKQNQQPKPATHGEIMARNLKRYSPSQLGTFEECPRNYWLDRHHGVAWPRGIFPSLPGGVDRVLKDHYDKHRALGQLPPELEGQVPGKLYPDQAKMDLWRNWRTGLVAKVPILDAAGKVIDEVIISGAFDDLLFDGEFHYVFDAKSRGSEPRPGATERYYGRQGNCYALMLEQNGYKASPKAFFGYYFPNYYASEIVDEKLKVDFNFTTEVVEIEVDANKSIALARRAYACIEGPIPEPCTGKCEKCEYIEARSSVGRKLKAAEEAAKESAAA